MAARRDRPQGLGGARVRAGWLEPDRASRLRSGGPCPVPGDRRPARSRNPPPIITTALQGNIFTTPDMVAAGPDGSVYIASQDYRIYQLIPGQGGVSVFAGNGQYGDSGDGGLAINAQLTTPYGVAVAPDGSVYIAEPYSDRIRKVDPSGIITTFAGTGAEGYSGDGGPANAALLNRPFGVAVGPDGSVYVADSNNNVIRRIGPDGIITTVAGTGTYSFSGDGGLATQATLRSPQDVAVA